MIASSESSQPPVDDYSSSSPPAMREFQSKSINSFNDMKEKWKVLLFGSGRSSWVQ
jgi:hypothetical protein